MDPSQVNDPKYSYDDPEVNYGPAPPAYGGAQQMTPIPSQPQHSVSASNVTVVVNQPTTQQQNPLMATTLDGHRTWTTGLFDCFADMGSCCLTMFCYPCAICNIASRLGECFCAPACVPGGEILLRNRIRSVGGIRGTMCDDCMVVACCGPCAACQAARELNNMGIP